MGLPRTAGRQGRPWRRLRANLLAHDDRCVWCGHPGSRAVNHAIPLSVAPHLAHSPDNLQPIHGVERCPTCNRACNSELGARTIGVDAVPPTRASRDW